MKPNAFPPLFPSGRFEPQIAPPTVMYANSPVWYILDTWTGELVRDRTNPDRAFASLTLAKCQSEIAVWTMVDRMNPRSVLVAVPTSDVADDVARAHAMSDVLVVLRWRHDQATRLAKQLADAAAEFKRDICAASDRIREHVNDLDAMILATTSQLIELDGE